jgi:BetR domain
MRFVEVESARSVDSTRVAEQINVPTLRPDAAVPRMSGTLTGMVMPIQNSGPTLREAFAAEVRAELARARISGRQLAAMLGKAQPWVSRRLTGAVAFDMDDVQVIADLLQIDPARMVKAANEATKNPRRPESAGASRGALVAGTGFEPVTSGL